MRLNKALAHNDKVDMIEVEHKLGKIKDQGNKLYGEKNYKEAIAKFTEGIQLFLKDQPSFKKDKDAKLKIIQLYTNRSLSYH
jgi:hypothetical protein